MPDLLAGTIVAALDTPPTVYAQDTTAITNISSTSYIPGTPEVGVTFIAPTTGRVMLSVGASMRNDAANSDRVAVTAEIRENDASGAVFLAATVFRGVATDGIPTAGDYCTVGHTTLVTGLTPGGQYFARSMHIKFGSVGTTGDIAMRDILVAPAT